MSDTSFDDITLPNAAPIPQEARIANAAPGEIVEVVPWWPQGWPAIEALRKIGPYLLAGFAIGLIPVCVAFVAMFIVDYAYLGGLWYAVGIAGGTTYVGIWLGALTIVCIRRVK